jgi:5-methylcytosine-specific restriction endonuclease McrA
MRRWTKDEEVQLSEAYTTLLTAEVYALFPTRTKKSVQRKAQELQLNRPVLITIEEKRCRKCQAVKAIDQFGRDNRVRDGRQSHCSQCSYSYQRAARIADPSIVRREYARRKGSRHVDKVTIEDVYEKTNGICYLCDKIIDRTLTHPNSYSLSMDHRIPISKGGEHTYENLWATHLTCNLRKNSKIV